MTVVLCYSSNKKLINLLLLFLLEHVHPLKASWLPFLPEYQELSNLHVLLWLGHSSTQTPGTSSVPGGLHDMTGWPDWFDATTFLAMCVAWDTFSGFWGFRGLVLRKDSLFAFLNFTWIPSCEWHRASWMHVCVLLDGFVFSKLVASIYYAAPTRNLGIFLNSLLSATLHIQCPSSINNNSTLCISFASISSLFSITSLSPGEALIIAHWPLSSGLLSDLPGSPLLGTHLGRNFPFYFLPSCPTRFWMCLHFLNL